MLRCFGLHRLASKVEGMKGETGVVEPTVGAAPVGSNRALVLLQSRGGGTVGPGVVSKMSKCVLVQGLYVCVNNG